ncbi:hypothetical protein QBC40DRAFT_191892 [Triangularia verruculosa]|uniref:NADH dehydrogenase [ubiquinone] 1 alpha subcomplex subunit 12 n=1 Tax=Triangularia verruculosa TaxID=2587418 RepID=A0AAN6XRI2_9PEZI|nr:hypothetical protein QBC40DRAFT_191892 [Triangularia verruculosa]
MSKPPLSLWQKWKALRLPWRRHFLAGKDLAGNTYWEFHDRGDPNPAKWRRILRPNPALNLHHSDVKIPPQWHQWLRHTRPNPPSIEEQQLDLVRQERLKILAAEADRRWEAKPRYIEEDSTKETPKPALEGSGMWVEKKLEQAQGKEGEVVPKEVKREEVWEGMKKQAEKGRDGEVIVGGKKKIDPWKQKRAGPGEEWQPQGWTPGAAKKP